MSHLLQNRKKSDLKYECSQYYCRGVDAINNIDDIINIQCDPLQRIRIVLEVYDQIKAENLLTKIFNKKLTM